MGFAIHFSFSFAKKLMDVALQYTCPCNQRNYGTRARLIAHQKTKTHVAWEDGAELRQLRTELLRTQNKIVALEAQLKTLQSDKATLRRLNDVLIKRISAHQ